VTYQTRPYTYTLINTPMNQFPYPGYPPQEPPEMPARYSANRQLLLLLVIPVIISFLFIFLLPPGKFTDQAAAGQSTAAVAAQSEAAETAAAAAAPKRTGILSPLFRPEVRYWEAKIVGWANEFGLDPNIVAIVMQVESCGDPKAASGAGAQGLFQVMPFHFSPGEDMLDPDTNARRGMAYLVERLAQTEGDLGRSFAGYNGGHVAAGSSWDNWANETQRYYIWTTGIYGDIQAGGDSSPTLDKWMASGGASLCRQAASSLGLPVE